MVVGVGNMNMGPKASMVKFSESCDGACRVAPEAMPGLGSLVEGQVPYVLYRFYTDDLMKPLGSIRIVRMCCTEHTNTILRCFINLVGLNYGDKLVGVVHEFVSWLTV
jgi:hypothetical protein